MKWMHILYTFWNRSQKESRIWSNTCLGRELSDSEFYSILSIVNTYFKEVVFWFSYKFFYALMKKKNVLKLYIILYYVIIQNKIMPETWYLYPILIAYNTTILTWYIFQKLFWLFLNYKTILNLIHLSRFLYNKIGNFRY